MGGTNYSLKLWAFEKINLYAASWSSLVAQTVKNVPTMWETWVQSLGWEDPLEKGMATHSSILAWRILWIEEPGGLQSVGSQSQTRLSRRDTFLELISLCWSELVWELDVSFSSTSPGWTAPNPICPTQKWFLNTQPPSVLTFLCVLVTSSHLFGSLISNPWWWFMYLPCPAVLNSSGQRLGHSYSVCWGLT